MSRRGLPYFGAALPPSACRPGADPRPTEVRPVPRLWAEVALQEELFVTVTNEPDKSGSHVARIQQRQVAMTIDRNVLTTPRREFTG